MPKILYLATEDWFFASHFLPMARAARAAGLDVVVAARAKDQAARIIAEGFRFVASDLDRTSLQPLQAVRDIVRTRGIIRSEQPDIVHCIALRPVLAGGIAARLARTRALVLAPTGLGHLWIERGPGPAVARHLMRFAVGSWLRSPRTRYVFENREDPPEFGLDPDAADVTIVGGAGIDPRDFPLVPEPPAPPVKVAVVARMIRHKGIAEAVAAARAARALGAPLELNLFGDPDPSNPNSLPISTLQAWSSEPAIKWHGRVSDIARVWREHHIALLLSYREGLPRSLVEAAAAGRPIVAADVTGCREVVRDGENGFLVPLHDVDAAARALAALCADAALRQAMGAAGNARVQRRFTVQAVMAEVEKLYRSLAQFS